MSDARVDSAPRPRSTAHARLSPRRRRLYSLGDAEILGMSTRIMVMHEGRVTGILTASRRIK